MASAVLCRRETSGMGRVRLISGVEEIDAGVETDVDEVRGFGDVPGAQALKNSLPSPNVPAPNLSTGTCRPERPSCLNSMAGWMLRGIRRIHRPVARRELDLERAED